MDIILDFKENLEDKLESIFDENDKIIMGNQNQEVNFKDSRLSGKVISELLNLFYQLFEKPDLKDFDQNNIKKLVLILDADIEYYKSRFSNLDLVSFFFFKKKTFLFLFHQ